MTDSPRTSHGRPATDSQIDHLACEADAGYDPAELRRSGGRQPIGSASARAVPVRLEPELDAALK